MISSVNALFVNALLLFGIFLLFFYRLGGYPLFDPDEPRYAETARQMIEHGHWITPWFNDAIRLDKPVLFYWMVAGAYRLLGVSEFSARFCSAATATLTVLMTYGFARHVLSRRAGLFSAVILATSLLFVGVGRMAITDMTLTAWMTGATLCLFLTLRRSPGWWAGFGVFAGLGLLTKGPVGLVVPLGIFSIYSLLIVLSGDRDSVRQAWLTRWTPLGPLLALAIALPWYLLAWRENGPIFWDALFLHNVTRYSAVVSGHQQPGWYYAAVLLAGFMPWTPWLPAALARLWRQARADHRQRVARGDAGYRLALYAATWAVFVFLFFSVAQSRLPS
jgi:4-amino-4-deoxy-L-arabinose transferase-like glycosyltransferase